MVPPTSYWSPAQSRAKPANPAREGRGASAGSRQADRQWDRDGARHGTFHPDVELAQLALQFILQQTHVLGTDRRMDRAYEQPPMDSAPCQPSQPAAHLCVLLVALAGLGQALACLPAAWRACAVSLDHVVGSITEPPLDAVSLIQLIYLQGQARAAVRGRAGDSMATPALPQLSPCWHETPGDAGSARLTSLAGKAEEMV